MNTNKDNRPIGQQASDAAQSAKEDVKGAARRVEGNLTGNQAQQREHEPSTLEWAGEKMKEGCQAVSDSACSAAEKMGLKNPDNKRTN